VVVEAAEAQVKEVEVMIYLLILPYQTNHRIETQNPKK
jgi:hypothetical protein